MTTPYFTALREAMSLVAAQPGAIFIGQSVVAGGTAMSRTVEHLHESLRLEVPVFEETQMGMATGLALAGHLPVTCYPRINFMLLAIGQLVLHLDALPIYSDGGFRPRVIIRTLVAHNLPMDPGPQHLGNFIDALRLMLKTIKVVELKSTAAILPAYQDAIDYNGSTLLVEFSELYDV